MAKMSRDKGARYERELANDAEALGLPAARTAQLQAGGRVDGAADVTLFDYLDVHIEAKRDETKSIDAMVRQAEADAPPSSVPVVVYRRNRQVSRAVVPWTYLLGLLRDVKRLRIRVEYLEAQLQDAESIIISTRSMGG